MLKTIGPFRVNHDDANLTGNGIELAAIAANTVVFKAFAVTREPWTMTGAPVNPTIQIGLGPVGSLPAGTWKELAIYDAVNTGKPGFEAGHLSDDLGNLVFGLPRAAAPLVASILLVYADPGGEAFLTGQFDVYALVSTPA